MKQKAKVIGIVGSIASGKSTVASMLKSLGADVIDADKICHQLINTQDIAYEITKRWGNQLLDDLGKINRRALAETVFSDKEKLSILNSIIHPEAIQQIKRRISKLQDEATTKAIVLDAALLVETNLINICDITIFVDTEKNVCRTRAQINRKWSLDEIAKRENFQCLLQQKREIADVIINNNNTKEETLNHVKDFWHQFII